MEIKGSELFVKALRTEGVDFLFAYPGGYVIDLFDALYDESAIEVILPRHEQALIHAADGYARSTGKTGVCLVTSGPGATNLVTGIATANYDSVPLVCFTGQVATELLGNDAFQEVDIVNVVRSVCKYAVTVRDRRDLGRMIKKAFWIAKDGKPGVVVVDLPRDIQRAKGSGAYPAEVEIRGRRLGAVLDMEQIEAAMNALSRAKRPLLLIGGGAKISGAGAALTRLIEKTGIPVVTTIMGKGTIASNHPLYIGNLGMHGNYASNRAVSECDVLLSIGTRFSDRILGRASEFAKYAMKIQVDIDFSAVSRMMAVDLRIVADANIAAMAMLTYASAVDVASWVKSIEEWKISQPITMEDCGLTPQRIFEKINERFKRSIIVTDVGQNQLWATQFLELDENRNLLTSGGFGTMGYGLPAAIGAKLGNADMDVICVTGDGGIQMNLQELATAVAQELLLIVCVLNNSCLGNVRQWQKLFFHKRYASTCLRYRKSCKRTCGNAAGSCPPYTPDFIAIAESYGAKGIRVERVGDMDAAFDEAKNHANGPTIIEFIIDREADVFPIVPVGGGLRDMLMEFREEES